MPLYSIAAPRGARRPDPPHEPNLASPQALGLIQWLPAPQLWDPIRQLPLTRAGVTALSRQGTLEGLGLRTTSNNDYWTFPALTLPTTGFSLAWWGVKVSTAAPYVYMSSGNNASLFAGLMLNLGDAGAWFAQHGDNTGSASSDYRRAATSSTLAVARLYHLVAVCRGDTDWSLYQDGSPLTPTYSGTGGAKADASGAGALGRGGTATNAPNAITVDCRVYNRALSDGDVQHLWGASTRWDLYRSLPRGAMVFLSGASAYSLDAQPGAYAVTGSAAGVVHAAVLNAASGSYALTGALAGTAYQPAINAVAGSYALTGSAAGLPVAVRFNAQPGSYALTGAAATLAYGAVLSADPGVYTLTGVDATLEDDTGGGVAYELAADPGVFAVTGAAAGVVYASRLNAQPGAIALTGAAATLAYGATLTATPGAITLTGAAAGVALAAALSATPGSLSVTGASAGLSLSAVLSADPGAYTLTGLAADLPASSDLVLPWIALTDVSVTFSALSGTAVAFPALTDVAVAFPALSALSIETPEDV